MQKHKLTICCGTSCSLITGNRTDKLKELINKEFSESIEIVPSGCLGQCSKIHNNEDFIPPFVKFNGEILYNATNDNILNYLRNKLK